MPQTIVQPVIRGVRFFLAHTPGLVRYGLKPARELVKDPGLITTISAYLRRMRRPPRVPPTRRSWGASSRTTSAAMANPGSRRPMGRGVGGHMARSCRRRNFTGS